LSPLPFQGCHIGGVIGGEEFVALSTTSGVYIVVGTVLLFIVAIVVATMAGRRWGRRAISQRLTSLGSRLGLDPPEDETNIETALAYLEQVTGGAAQSVAESSSDAIRLRRSLDTLTQGVVLCDENGSVIYRNGRANALMVSRHGDALAAQAVTELLEGAWHEGTAERTLDLYGPPRRTLQVRARQIDDGRRPLGVIALIEDISERRRLEEIRRDFVANVSHELKTPIGALGLLAETLMAEPDAEVAQRLAGRIHNEAFRVSRIIDDLLDLSRIESEEAPSREPVLVNLVMADAIERVRSTADQRGIEIVLHEPSPPIAVVGERRQLVSAMHALLENAITYSYDDSKVVVTGTVRRPTGHAHSGDAALMPPEPVEAAFTPDILNEDGTPRAETAHGETAPTESAPTGDSPAETGRTETGHVETSWAATATSTTGPVPLEGEPTLGGVDSGTRTDWRSEEREHVRLSVQDSGIGIPARDLDRIFERFYRVDHGRSRDTGGTGLGLSIVRHVANNHQGWVDVESREGEGSTFSLVLPLHTDRLI
jgi:signal transduction histidine kinase